MYGEEHPEIGIEYEKLGFAYCQIGNYKKSIRYLNNSLTILTKFFPKDHQSVLNCKETLVFVERKEKREKL